MLALSIVSNLLFILLLCYFVWQSKTLSQSIERWQAKYDRLDRDWRLREADWQKREAGFVDRLLKQAKVEPFQPKIEQERVLKLPDPELAASSEWFRDDAILEMIEENVSDTQGLSSDQLQVMMPDVWKKYEKRYLEEHAPLRIA